LPFTVSASKSCTINITLSPSASGEKKATLTIASSDPVSPSVSVDLSGTAVAPVTINASVTAGSPAGSGSISPQGTILAVPGSSPTFFISPHAGYHIADVVVNGVSKGAVTSVSLPQIAANATITASFAVNTYTVTMNTGAHGIVFGPASAIYGATPSYTIQPDANYHVADIKVDGISRGSGQSLTLPPIFDNVQITTTFTINTFAVSIIPGANGTITGPAIVNYGDSPTYTITPINGYHVTDVVVNGVSKGAVTTFTMPPVTANAAISASFAISPFTITASTDAKGSISPIGNVSVFPGGSQKFTFTPFYGYSIVNVLVDGVPQGAISTYTFNNLASDNHTIKLICIPDGDVNNDGKVDIVDAILALKIAVGQVSPTAINILHGDVAPFDSDKIPVPDKKITVEDALQILRKAVGVTSGW
jgi:hypothetical protein